MDKLKKEFEEKFSAKLITRGDSPDLWVANVPGLWQWIEENFHPNKPPSADQRDH